MEAGITFNSMIYVWCDFKTTPNPRHNDANEVICWITNNNNNELNLTFFSTIFYLAARSNDCATD